MNKSCQDISLEFGKYGGRRGVKYCSISFRPLAINLVKMLDVLAPFNSYTSNSFTLYGQSIVSIDDKTYCKVSIYYIFLSLLTSSLSLSFYFHFFLFY